MKKWILIFILHASIIPAAPAQTDKQFCIRTTNGLLTVSKTLHDKDMIIISTACWDLITAGTKYSSYYLSSVAGKTFYLEIADNKRGLCKKGIGFGCSIFDCPTIHAPPKKVNAANRICSVTAKKTNAAVTIIFNDEVDWISLQNDD